MNTYLKKFKGQNEQLVPKSTISEIIFAFIGSFIAIGIIGYCTKTYDNLLIMGSFGASCKNRSKPDNDARVRPDAKTEFNRTVKRCSTGH